MAEYIEREAAVKAFNNFDAGRADSPPFTLLTPEEFAEYLYELPAADVAPVVHGRWISWEKAGNYVPSPDRHECSVCHDAAQVLVNGFELLSDYFPNCGAKMDGDRKDGGDG